MAALLGSTTVHSREEIRLEPSSEWQFRQGKDICRAVRLFGQGDNRSIFMLEKYELGSSYFILMAGKPFTGFWKDRTGTIQFGPDEAAIEYNFEHGKFGKFEPGLYSNVIKFGSLKEVRVPVDFAEPDGADFIRYEAFSPERRQSISSAAIRNIANDDVVLAIGSMEEPLEKLDQCVDLMMEGWGIDVAKHKVLSRPAIPATNPGRWITWQDYPKDLLQGRVAGQVNFRVIVGIDGKPVECSVSKTFRSRGFDEAVCDNLMDSSRFKPALDADGTPIVSYWRSTVRFQIAN